MIEGRILGLDRLVTNALSDMNDRLIPGIAYMMMGRDWNECLWLSHAYCIFIVFADALCLWQVSKVQEYRKRKDLPSPKHDIPSFSP